MREIAYFCSTNMRYMPQPIPADDEEGSIFLSSAASDSFTSFISSCSRIDDSHLEADEDMFFGPESSFVLNIKTPSPQSKTALPMNFKHRNSLLVSDEDDTDSSTAGEAMPTYDLTSKAGVDVDAFIIRTLAAASKGPHLPPKRIPGTPVKKVRMSYFGNDRPWQSAVAPKVGLRNDFDFNKRKKVPRKSLPAVFPPVGAKPSCDQTTDSEDDQESPITRREKYTTLGLGQPSCKNAVSGIPRSRWLMRRSSSGAFSSGSDSASLANTPTRSKGIGEGKNHVFACCILTKFYDFYSNRLASA